MLPWCDRGAWVAVGGPELEGSRVQASVRLVLDPVNPSLPGRDVATSRSELGISRELRRRADRSVQAVAQPVLLQERCIQPLDRAVALLIDSKRAGKPHRSIATTSVVATHGNDKLSISKLDPHLHIGIGEVAGNYLPRGLGHG